MTEPTAKYKPYAVGQAQDVIPLIDFTPRWLIDCGPGFGQEAKEFKERWPNIRVIGLEPSPTTLDLLLGNYPGTLYSYAAWSSSGSMNLFGADTEMGASLVYQGNNPQARLEVQTIKLDTLNLGIGPIEDAILWADVEGAEREVLLGASDLIKNGKIRLINVEVHDGESEQSMDALCASLGFKKVKSYAHNGAHHDNVYILDR